LCSTESLTDPQIEAAFINAATKRGVKVQLLAPQCDENPKPALNIAAMQDINQKVQAVCPGMVIAKVMPGLGAGGAGTAATPYIHAKMCLANYPPAPGGPAADAAFVGSVNLSTDSTASARELGVVFRNKGAEAQIQKAFAGVWKQAIAPVASSACPAPPPPPEPAAKPSFPACSTTSTENAPSPADFSGIGDSP
jgi:phosphatidylserine/phosphatidylglycerophosphate/cardiolipin synthase-like enzyme